jgi:site-specific recombinase XerD
VKPADLDAVILAGRERGLSRETLRGWAGTLRSFFTDLHQRGLVLTNPALTIARTPRDQVALPPSPLTEPEVHALIAAIPRRSVVDLRNAAHVEVLYGCGLRLSESINLDLDDIDHRQRTLLIRDGKGGKDRLMPLPGSAHAALQDYVALRRNLLKGPDHGAVFLSQQGRRLSKCGFSQWLAGHAAKVLGEDRHVHPHLLRHSVATHLLRGGCDIKNVQVFLGHSDIETTKVYLRLVPGHLREDYDDAMPALA